MIIQGGEEEKEVKGEGMFCISKIKMIILKV